MNSIKAFNFIKGFYFYIVNYIFELHKIINMVKKYLTLLVEFKIIIKYKQ